MESESVTAAVVKNAQKAEQKRINSRNYYYAHRRTPPPKIQCVYVSKKTGLRCNIMSAYLYCNAHCYRKKIDEAAKASAEAAAIKAKEIDINKPVIDDKAPINVPLTNEVTVIPITLTKRVYKGYTLPVY